MRRIESQPRLVRHQPVGGIIGHEMGLGKTRTVLAFLAESLEREKTSQKTLIVCPKTVIFHWMTEASVFSHFNKENDTNSASFSEISLYHGIPRNIDSALSSQNCIVITTFEIIRKEGDASPLHSVPWTRIVLDEAHRICEHTSKTANAIRLIRAPNRWCVTGTPIRNGVGDIASLARFINVAPFSKPVWWRVNSKNQKKLSEWRKMFLCIKTKDILSLPSVVQKTVLVESTRDESDYNDFLQVLDGEGSPKIAEQIGCISRLYMTTLQQNIINESFELQDESKETGNTEEKNMFYEKKPENELLKILRLRQAANNPILTLHSKIISSISKCEQNSIEGSNSCCVCGTPVSYESSVKCPPERCAASHSMCSGCSTDSSCCYVCAGGYFRRAIPPLSSKFKKISDEIDNVSEDEKIIIFSQWTTCLDLIARLIEAKGIGYAQFDGRISAIADRNSVLERFKKERECRILLTSIGAGSEGLNLVVANNVFIIEPYWNASTEQQAIDRCHRIGQNRTVKVIRFVSENSIEEWVSDIKEKKSIELKRVLYGIVLANEDFEKDQDCYLFGQKLHNGKKHKEETLTPGDVKLRVFTSVADRAKTSKNMLSQFIK